MNDTLQGRNSDKPIAPMLMDALDVYLTELLDMIHQPNKNEYDDVLFLTLIFLVAVVDKIRWNQDIYTLNEIANSYGVNRVPTEQYLPPLPGKSPNTAHTKLKRKAPETAWDREKKREIDKAYRLRCRENKKKTEKDLVVLTEENNKLKRENDQF